jgi:hypothetical protein
VRKTLTSLLAAAGGGALLGYAASGVVDLGLATPIVAVVGVIGVMLGITAGGQEAAVRLESEHGWFWRELARELDRSRRHGHVFALARIQPEPSPEPMAVAGLGLPRRSTIGRLGAYLRAADRAWQDADGAVYLLLPETGRESADDLFERIGVVAPELVPREGRSMVTFPEDGTTSGALLGALSVQHMASSGAASPAAAIAGSTNADRGAA